MKRVPLPDPRDGASLLPRHFTCCLAFWLVSEAPLTKRAPGYPHDIAGPDDNEVTTNLKMLIIGSASVSEFFDVELQMQRKPPLKGGPTVSGVFIVVYVGFSG